MPKLRRPADDPIRPYATAAPPRPATPVPLASSFSTERIPSPGASDWPAPVLAEADNQNYCSDVIYQIFTDRFAAGRAPLTPSGPGTKRYCGGDWDGIVRMLRDGYFTRLGVTALWISQPVDNIDAVISYAEAEHTSYHGYWARDFKRANARFGGMDAFRRLVAAAHERGIKLVIDFAPNHTSPAMETDPGFGENGRLYDDGRLLGGYSDDDEGLFHHYGGTDFLTPENDMYRNVYDMADLNHHHPVIDRYFKEAIRLWLDLGIDGVRVDAAKHMPPGWQKNWLASIYRHRPVFVFGEWFLGSAAPDEGHARFANESGMSLLDFRLCHQLRSVFRDRTATMRDLHETMLSTARDYERAIDQVTFLDNHDMARFAADGVPDRALELALVFLLTSRGVPAIFYGTERYLTGDKDPRNRGTMDAFSEETVAFRVIRALAPLRRRNPALAYGTTRERWLSPDVYVYERRFGDSVAVVAINRSLERAELIRRLDTSLPSGSYPDELDGLLGGRPAASRDGRIADFALGPGEAAVWQHVSAAESVPLIGHVGPTMGQAGSEVAVDGRGFGPRRGAVLFGESEVPADHILSWTDSRIRVRVPDIRPAGRVDLRVRTAAADECSRCRACFLAAGDEVAAGEERASAEHHADPSARNGCGRIAANASRTSAGYGSFEVLSGEQVLVRFVVRRAWAAYGEQLYAAGDVAELGGWSTERAAGPFANQVVHEYPDWYCDVSVPAGAELRFKFFLRCGTRIRWENGPDRLVVTPRSGTATVTCDWRS